MPRTGKGPGGPRSGTPGAQYANRSDLRNPNNEQASGQEYGERAQQQAAQQAVPVTPPATAVPTSQPGATISPIKPTAPQPQQAGPAPGELTSMFAPTERPGEPVTHGVNIGPGAGQEAMNATALGHVISNSSNGDTAAALLTSLAARPDAGTTLQNLARIAANGPIR